MLSTCGLWINMLISFQDICKAGTVLVLFEEVCQQRERYEFKLANMHSMTNDACTED